MSDIEADAELSQIEAKVAALCEGGLAGRAYYLLSELGKALGEDLVRLKVLSKLKLAEFIEARLADRFAVITVERFGNVRAVVLAGSVSTSATEPSSVAVAPTATPQTTSAEKHRYHYRFWAAFAVPGSGRTRYLDPEELTFEDRDPTEAPEGHLEIPSDLIAPQGIERRDDAILSNIDRWLSANNLSRDRFLESYNRSRLTKSPPLQRQEATALDVMIAALDRRQLAATSLSLDVVAALLKKRI